MTSLRIFLLLIFFSNSFFVQSQNADNCSSITVYRPKKFSGSLISTSVFINGVKKGVLTNNSQLKVGVENQGTYNVSIQWATRGEEYRERTTKTIIINCNQNHYLKINASALIAEKILLIVPQGTALKELKEIPSNATENVETEIIPNEEPIVKSNTTTISNTSTNPPSKEATKYKTPTNTVTTTLPPKETELAPVGKNYALFIGVNEYKDPTIADLDQPIKDVQSLYAVLTEEYTFNKEDVIFLKNPSKNEITLALEKYFEIITENDNLLIFYAGHGHWDPQFQQGYWLPEDALNNNRGTWLSNGTIRDYMRGIPSKHTLLITDACFGGGIFKSRAAFPNASVAINQLSKLPSRKAMTSGAMSEVPDKSVFIEYLVKRLRQNTEQYLSSEQLFASFKIAVINNSANGQIPQFGEIKETGDEGGDFIFFKKN